MYVDGFVVPIKKDRIEEYRAMALTAGKVWMDSGALSYVETVAEDVPDGEVTSFPIALKLEDGEVPGFAWVTYNSREHRDEVMAKVMAHEDMQKMPEDPPMNTKRMFFGGFETIAQL
ncbi:MAG TPA: DUF1428 domain-containing protein [Gemmatimonadales bacterium]|nr:DUF1428 domain-containing protein [Gemmatimonadales bacterium]